MAKYIIDESTLKNLANAIRSVNGESKMYTPDEMVVAISNIMDSVTYILDDGFGDPIAAVYVSSETIFDATAGDIRSGKTAATDDGITVGTLNAESGSVEDYDGSVTITDMSQTN